MKIIVNSVPKSGTHLLGKLMQSIGFEEWDGAGLTGALVRETYRNPLKNLEVRKRRPKSGGIGLWIDLDIKENRVDSEWLHKYLSRIPHGTYVSGHLPYSEDLSIFLQIHGFRLFHIIRDPRDILISYINYQKSQKNYPFHKVYQTMSLDQAIAHALGLAKQRGIVSAPLRERINRSLGWLSDPAIYSLRFESLIGPRGGGESELQIATVKNVCGHLGLSFGDGHILKLAAKVFDVSSETFHKGLINQWQDALNCEQKYRINEALGDVITVMGYSL